MNRLDKGVSAGVAESTRRHISWLETKIAQLEKEYQEALQARAQLAQRAALTGPSPVRDRSLRPPRWPFSPNWASGTARR